MFPEDRYRRAATWYSRLVELQVQQSEAYKERAKLETGDAVARNQYLLSAMQAEQAAMDTLETWGQMAAELPSDMRREYGAFVTDTLARLRELRG